MWSSNGEQTTTIHHLCNTYASVGIITNSPAESFVLYDSVALPHSRWSRVVQRIRRQNRPYPLSRPRCAVIWRNRHETRSPRPPSHGTCLVYPTIPARILRLRPSVEIGSGYAVLVSSRNKGQPAHIVEATVPPDFCSGCGSSFAPQNAVCRPTSDGHCRRITPSSGNYVGPCNWMNEYRHSSQQVRRNRRACSTH